jgi:hypothetical protein
VAFNIADLFERVADTVPEREAPCAAVDGARTASSTSGRRVSLTR